MGLLDFLFGGTTEKREGKGDSLFEAGEYGYARMEYEAALAALSPKEPYADALEERLREKLLRTREALARRHLESGDELAESGCHRDARESYRLALQFADDEALAARLEELLKETARRIAGENAEFSHGTLDALVAIPAEEYFDVLCNTLPPELQDLYRQYGEAFRAGYAALHQGQFQQAAGHLAAAREEHPDPESYVAFELATAFVNLQRYDEARPLLEGFLRARPAELQPYRLLCEICWEEGDYDGARELLSASPAELAGTAPLRLLLAETCFRAGDYDGAESLYREYASSQGWNDEVMEGLARTLEAGGKKEEARKAYGEILDKSRSCRSQPASLPRQRYAELSFESGERSTHLLEIYISLLNNDGPGNRAAHCLRIAEIYEAQGHEGEAERYRILAGSG